METLPHPPRVLLVAIDLDGTLLTDDKRISEKTAAALMCLGDKGVRVVIASARPPRSVRAIYQLLKLQTVQINYNGALIWDEPARRAVFHLPMAGGLVREIIAFSRDYFDEVQVSCEVMDRWFTDSAEQPFTTETGRLFKPDVVAPLEDFAGNDTTKLMLLGEPSMIARLEPLLLRQFAGTVAIVQTDDHLLQIMNPAAGKSAALRKVAAMHGIDMENVMAIGDAPNDVGMLQIAGIAVAMDNAKPVVKEVADWIAPSNNDHGVHAALVRYGLCEI